MRLIDVDKLDETIIDLNDKGWDVTRSEYKRLDAILFEMPPVKAIHIDNLNQIRAEIESRLQGVNITLEILAKDDALTPRLEASKTTLEEVLDIFNKYIQEDNV